MSHCHGLQRGLDSVPWDSWARASRTDPCQAGCPALLFCWASREAAAPSATLSDVPAPVAATYWAEKATTAARAVFSGPAPGLGTCVLRVCLDGCTVRKEDWRGSLRVGAVPRAFSASPCAAARRHERHCRQPVPQIPSQGSPWALSRVPRCARQSRVTPRRRRRQLSQGACPGARVQEGGACWKSPPPVERKRKRAPRGA